jgi:excisionase family DNA binding protein
MKKKAASVAADDLLRMPEVASMLGCSISQGYRLAKLNLIPTVRIRGMVRSPRAQLKMWIEKNSRGEAV